MALRPSPGPREADAGGSNVDNIDDAPEDLLRITYESVMAVSREDLSSVIDDIFIVANVSTLVAGNAIATHDDYACAAFRRTMRG